MKTIQLALSVMTMTVTVALVSLCFISCHTTRGLGRDVEKLGEEIQEEAGEHTRY